MNYLTITPELVGQLLPVRPRNADKETFGRVLVLAGSKGMLGAALFCSRAVLRTGAGIALLGLPDSLARFANANSPEVMTIGLPETDWGSLAPQALTGIKKIMTKMKAIAIGPGLSRQKPTISLVGKTLRLISVKYKKLKLVVDADGLKGLVRFSHRPAAYIPVITPHAGELSGLLKVTRRAVEKYPVRYALKAARKFRVLVVLKGYETIIVSPYSDEVLVNQTGNPGMATGGSGDVLTGMIAGLLAQGLDSRSAAVAGVFLHGLAGNIAALRLGQDGIIASDILESIPLALRRIRGR